MVHSSEVFTHDLALESAALLLAMIHHSRQTLQILASTQGFSSRSENYLL